MHQCLVAIFHAISASPETLAALGLHDSLRNISLLGVLKAFVLQEVYAKLKSLSNDMWLQASIVRVHHDAPAGVKSIMLSGQLRFQETQAVMSNFLQSWKTEMDVTRI